MPNRVDDSEMARRTEDFVVRRIEGDDLDLPALPPVAAQALELLEDPAFSAEVVTRLIENDPLVAARVLRLANSAAHATLEPARSVIQAVMRLGSDELRTFLIETAAKPLFESHDRSINALCRELWTHSVAVGLLARAIVRRGKGAHPEAAYLGGLLHDVGKPIIAAMLLDAEQRLFGTHTRTWLVPATWLALIGRVHRRVGTALAAAWRLPALVLQSVRDGTAYDRLAPSNPVNAVTFGNALAKHAGIYAGDVDPAEIAAFLETGRILFKLGDADVQALTDGLRQRVTERLT